MVAPERVEPDVVEVVVFVVELDDEPDAPNDLVELPVPDVDVVVLVLSDDLATEVRS